MQYNQTDAEAVAREAAFRGEHVTLKIMASFSDSYRPFPQNPQTIIDLEPEAFTIKIGGVA